LQYLKRTTLSHETYSLPLLDPIRPLVATIPPTVCLVGGELTEQDLLSVLPSHLCQAEAIDRVKVAYATNQTFYFKFWWWVKLVVDLAESTGYQ
jgi:hypothetical protein